MTPNNGTSDIANKVDLAVTTVLSHALNFPAFVDHTVEDEELVELIQSLQWIQAEDLKATFNIDVSHLISLRLNEIVTVLLIPINYFFSKHFQCFLQTKSGKLMRLSL